MFSEYYSEILAQAVAGYPQECVWLITESGCRQVKNTADNPEETFSISRHDSALAVAEGLLAVVHSHPDFPACPSAADMRGQVATGVPWGIVRTDGVTADSPVWFGDLSNSPPLLGRGYRHGVTDCYSLIRDYYWQELSQELPEFPRDWEWWKGGQDLYRDGYAPANFRIIPAEEAAPGDVWLAQIKSPVPNHGGVLIESGLTIHHPGSVKPVDPSQLSRREPITRWMPYITTWLRHESR